MNISMPFSIPHLGRGARAAGLLAAALVLAGPVGAVMAASPAPSPTASPAIAAGKPDAACATQWKAAVDDPTVSDLKALGDCEVNRRFSTLDRLTTAVDGAKALTSSDRTALLSIISQTRDGLTGLKSTIDSDTTVAQLRADLPRIATDYRVYLLVVPQVHLTRAADAGLAATNRLTQLSTKLQSWIDREQAAGKDVTAAQAALDAMKQQTALAAAQVKPVPGQVLPLRPADWNDGTARPILGAARDALKSARNEIQAARNDAQACVAALR